MFFNKNLTTHNSSSITVAMITVTDEDYPNEGAAMRNFFLYVDTCHISCLTCKGPTMVCKTIIQM